MAAPLPTLLILIIFSTLLAAFAVVSSTSSPNNYTYVCDEKRYAELGLDASLFAFCDKSLPFAVRAKQLIDSMTLHEKAKQLGSDSQGVERLGIPKYNWWSEALHGVSDVGGGSSFEGPVKGATSFPTPITTAAAFNESLWNAIGQTISTEARAMHNLGVAGLTFWSPNINVVRDPRWGRTLETPGECPFAVGRYAVQFVRGMQDVDGSESAADPNSRPLKVSTCCKHYAAYDVDYYRIFGGFRVDRVNYNANVTERDMVETFLRPFEMCVKDGDVSSVMCSYNNINGIPACADARLLRGTIRGDWNFHGYIVSDCDSIKTITEDQKWLDDTPQEATSQVMKAGLDLGCQNYYPKFLESTVKQGLLKESEIDNALFNNYMVLLRLGWFDGSPLYNSLDASDVCSVEHLKLAADAARQGMVLLKNNNTALPLSTEKFKKIAVVGPHLNATDAMIGNYAGTPCRYITPLDGFKKYAEVDHKVGCLDVSCHNATYIFPAVRAARDADATIIVTGLNLNFERESWDRSDLDLPGYQNELIRQVSAASKGPVVLVILSAGGVDISDHVNSSDVDAIVWAGYPGQEGGQAIADVVFGKYNPGGRLPVTWYPTDYVWQLPMTSQQLRPNDELGYPGRTYKFYNGTTIFPFGYGMSYTNFTYNVLSTQKMLTKSLGLGQHCHYLRYNESAYIPPCHAALISDINCDDDVTVEVLVKNTGEMDGSDVVMVYTRVPYGIAGAPIKQLVGFQRVFVKAGESETVKFELSSCKSLVFVTESAYEVVPAGEHAIIVGNGDASVEYPFNVYLNKEN